MDISTVSDLLREFMTAEAEILNQQKIKHPPTIGAMYEGLTGVVLEKSVFAGLDLHVEKNGFIEGSHTEFDVLLVRGHGKLIPYSGRSIYRPEQVIAVIQVKKNLYTKDIREGYENLKYLTEQYDSISTPVYVQRMASDAIRSVLRKDSLMIDQRNLTDNEDLIVSTLRVDATLPVRIVWGYNGFTSEYSLRESFFTYLQSNLTTNFDKKIGGYGPHNFPSQIVCGNFSMIKQTGMPFIVTLDGDWWPFYTTTSYNPLYFTLELIWTRLTYMFDNLSAEIFGEDLTMEPANRFIDCRLKAVGEHKGWEYTYHTLSDSFLTQTVEPVSWMPAEIDDKQFTIINELGRNHTIDVTDNKDLEKYILADSDYKSLDEFVERLLATGLVSFDNNTLRLLTDQCVCVFLPGGKSYAADNKTGRLTRWAEKEFEKFSQSNRS